MWQSLFPISFKVFFLFSLFLSTSNNLSPCLNIYLFMKWVSSRLHGHGEIHRVIENWELKRDGKLSPNLIFFQCRLVQKVFEKYIYYCNIEIKSLRCLWLIYLSKNVSKWYLSLGVWKFLTFSKPNKTYL